MKAVIYRRSDGYVIAVVDQVTSVTGGNVIGKDQELRGIDQAAAGVIVVDETKMKPGDKVDPSKLVDRSDSLPKTSEQQLLQRIADLEIVLADFVANGGA